ncbi:amidohydrolase family protein [Terrarubrum flagellatum]|uniref:amidohydrolase family protein n=1 Tax=Terrirubrum flagellatum TaxID=2895980 RepID=UPI003145029C
MNMNVAPGRVEAETRNVRLIADCDIHPTPNTTRDLYPWLDQRWRTHIETFGALRRQGVQQGPAYPKSQPDAARRDAWPEGGRPGSRLDFMQKQHLDANRVALGVLTTISPHPGAYQNPEMSAAFCRAVNEWQKAEWTAKDTRLKGSILVPYEHGDLAAAEIAHWAGDEDFVQILLLSRTVEPMGQRRYWPLYQAAQEAKLPIGVHAFGNGAHPITSSGWPSFYIEEMTGHAQTCQSQITSLVLEGVFERFPGLRIVVIEGGFAWLPPLAWRLDTHWTKLRAETPHLKRKPSEYIRDHVWITTQPMEEPQSRQHILDIFEWIGWDRLLFASDYPHWDFDDPARCLPIAISEDQAQRFFLDNALKLYGVDPAKAAAATLAA